jgi:hypothetical protein
MNEQLGSPNKQITDEIRGKEPSLTNQIPEKFRDLLVSKSSVQIDPKVVDRLVKLGETLPPTKKPQIKETAAKSYGGIVPRKMFNSTKQQSDNSKEREKEYNKEREQEYNSEVYLSDSSDIVVENPKYPKLKTVKNLKKRYDRDDRHKEKSREKEDRDEEIYSNSSIEITGRRSPSLRRSPTIKKRPKTVIRRYAKPQTKQDKELASKLLKLLEVSKENEQLADLTLRLISDPIRDTIRCSNSTFLHIFLDYSRLTLETSVSTFELEGLDKKYVFKAIVGTKKTRGQNNTMLISICPDSNYNWTIFNIVDVEDKTSIVESSDKEENSINNKDKNNEGDEDDEDSQERKIKSRSQRDRKPVVFYSSRDFDNKAKRKLNSDDDDKEDEDDNRNEDEKDDDNRNEDINYDDLLRPENDLNFERTRLIRQAVDELKEKYQDIVIAQLEAKWEPIIRDDLKTVTQKRLVKRFKKKEKEWEQKEKEWQKKEKEQQEKEKEWYQRQQSWQKKVEEWERWWAERRDVLRKYNEKTLSYQTKLQKHVSKDLNKEPNKDPDKNEQIEKEIKEAEEAAKLIGANEALELQTVLSLV